MKYYEIKYIAGRLRKYPTESEKLLWQYLRKRKLNGYKFLRQHPLYYEHKQNDHFFFVPDFYSPELKLIIELDGGIHFNLKDKDRMREEILKSKGFKILRLSNAELADIETVKQRIIEFINEHCIK